jgi:hypothetical protein
MYELRKRDHGDEPEPFWSYLIREGAALADVLGLASQSRETMDVFGDGGAYLVTYCGESPYWYPSDDGSMHQISSHGWCHDCQKEGRGYVHHLAYDVEFAALALEAAEDQVLAGMCEADGLTPEQYAASVAGRAVPADGDHSFAIDVRELGVNAGGLAEFAVDMWDMTTWKVAVPVAEGAPRTARDLAERMACDAQPKRCYDCHGTTGHSKRCGVTRERELCEKYPELAAKFPFHDPLAAQPASHTT